MQAPKRITFMVVGMWTIETAGFHALPSGPAVETGVQSDNSPRVLAD